jgi:ATP-dependent DNA helicase RecQ
MTVAAEHGIFPNLQHHRSDKLLCFELPSILRPGTACVISPLKALMSDQISELQRKKRPGTFINSDLDPEEKAARYELLAEDVFKFLYVAPERLSVRDKRKVERLLSLRPNFMVVDEAHCIDRWGDDFRPDYGRLMEVGAVSLQVLVDVLVCDHAAEVALGEHQIEVIQPV